MTKKFGLGKGLGALIPEDDGNISNNIDDSKRMISINMIKANNEQPRKNFDSQKINELSQSIKDHGIIQPLVLNKQGEFYTIIAGERRWRAAKLAGLKEVPAVIMDITDKQVLELSLIENIQREDLNPIEEAKAYNKLLKDFNMTHEDLSERLSKSRASITNTMRLLNLDERVQQYIIDGVISEGHGKVILSIDDKKLQYDMSQKVIDDGLSVRALEDLIRELNRDNKSIKENKDTIESNDIYFVDMKNRLQNYFGTKVNINSNKKGKGKIEIEYYSNEDLQRILDIIKA